MLFNLVIDTKEVASFQLAASGPLWGHKLDMEFDLPIDWNLEKCYEYIGKFVHSIEAKPYRNLVKYEQHVDSVNQDFKIAAAFITKSDATSVRYDAEYDGIKIFIEVSIVREPKAV